MAQNQKCSKGASCHHLTCRAPTVQLILVLEGLLLLESYLQ